MKQSSHPFSRLSLGRYDNNGSGQGQILSLNEYRQYPHHKDESSQTYLNSGIISHLYSSDVADFLDHLSKFAVLYVRKMN